jgi:hypothetical protein
VCPIVPEAPLLKSFLGNVLCFTIYDMPENSTRGGAAIVFRPLSFSNTS